MAWRHFFQLFVDFRSGLVSSLRDFILVDTIFATSVASLAGLDLECGVLCCHLREYIFLIPQLLPHIFFADGTLTPHVPSRGTIFAAEINYLQMGFVPFAFGDQAL
jgi:hypothetical protein